MTEPLEGRTPTKWLWLAAIILLGVVLLMWIFGAADQDDDRITPATTTQAVQDEQFGGLSQAPDTLVEAPAEGEAVEVQVPTTEFGTTQPQ